MIIEGTIEKDGKGVLVRIPAVDEVTGGVDIEDGFVAAKELIEAMVKVELKQKRIKVIITRTGPLSFSISLNKPEVLCALILKRTRTKAGLSLKEVSRRLGSSYQNSVAAYEKASRSPSFAQFEKIMTAMDPQASIVFIPGAVKKSAVS